MAERVKAFNTDHHTHLATQFSEKFNFKMSSAKAYWTQYSLMDIYGVFQWSLTGIRDPTFFLNYSDKH